MRVSVLSGVVFLTTSLGGALGSAASATDCSSIKAALQGPRSVTYQQKLLPVAPVGGQASAPMTFVVSSTVRPIPNGYQVQNVTDGKTHVLKQTCVGGKLVTELDGKRLDMGASAQSGAAASMFGSATSPTPVTSSTRSARSGRAPSARSRPRTSP